MTMKPRHLTLLCPLLLMAGHAIAAQDKPVDQPGAENASTEEKKDDNKTEKRAGEIVTQPVRDVGLSKKAIPPILIAAAESPYSAPKGKGCAAVTREMGQLNDALGPDFGTGTKENESKVGKLADAGGSWIVNSFIPFRGLVREVSGAASADRKLAAAVTAGMARRGYLRGVGQARKCKMPVG